MLRQILVANALPPRALRRWVARDALQTESAAAMACIREDGAACHLCSVAAPAGTLARLPAIRRAIEAEAAASVTRALVCASRFRRSAVQACVQHAEVGLSSIAGTILAFWASVGRVARDPRESGHTGIRV